ncbi:hypothetical protein L0V05_17175 [Tabrizicola sp. J26]|uniref:hypothetical protein n=1 Tax=Alitabrizicola rongguiensis TaxID=2909234 RepID=UPI001F19A467|nr:hypothetical protein [Tabrizicola rongguiensis]MCF1710544.1 hypothetical protein [Tabrizicola rongguiensis]
MQTDTRSALRIQDITLSPLKRAAEWLLLLGVLSILIAILLAFPAIFYAGGAKSRVGAFMDRADYTGLSIVLLGTFWWLTTAVLSERQAHDPAQPESARAVNQRIGRVFILVPVTTYMIAYATVALIFPAAEMAFLGRTIHLPMKVESVWWARDRDCHYKARVHIPGFPDMTEFCLSPTLFRAYHPADTLVASIRVHDTLYVIRGMNWAADASTGAGADETLPPEFAAFVLHRALAKAATAHSARDPEK